MCGVLPSHEGGSRRSAESRHVVTVQNDATVCQSVDIWCWNLCRAVKTYVIPSLNRQHNTQHQYFLGNAVCKTKWWIWSKTFSLHFKSGYSDAGTAASVDRHNYSVEHNKNFNSRFAFTGVLHVSDLF